MTPSNQVQTIPLAQCRHGHDFPLFPINPRQPDDDPEMAAFRAGLRQATQLQPARAILGKKGDTAYVYIGGRRLTALTMNAADDPSAPTTINLFIDDIEPAEALFRSIAEQDKQKSLHPADQARSYADLNRNGVEVGEIAKRFAVKAHKVKQLLALGAGLSDLVWTAWRADEMDLQTAQAFTLASGASQMNEVFERLKKGHQLTHYNVRKALQGDQGDAARFVNFIGIDAYSAAGGEVIVDLFEGLHTISDKPLAVALAAKKLEDECARLRDEDGWSWAQDMASLPASWQAWTVSVPKVVNYTDEEAARLEAIETEQIPLRENDELTDEQSDRFDALDIERARIQAIAEMRSFTDRQKKKSGCVLTIDSEGRLVVKPGVIRPVEPRAEGGVIREGEPPPLNDPPGDGRAEVPKVKAPQISKELKIDLDWELTEAAEIVVRDRFDLAMSIALAALQSGTDRMPARLWYGERDWDNLHLTDYRTFAENLAAFHSMSNEQRAKLFCIAISKSLKFEPSGGAKFAAEDDSVAALLKVLPADELREAIATKFDSAYYFDEAPKAFALAAIEDSNSKEIASKWEGKPKSEVVEAANKLAASMGWVPIELRPPGAFWDGQQPAAQDKEAKVKNPAKPAGKPIKKALAVKVAKKPGKKVAKKAGRK